MKLYKTKIDDEIYYYFLKNGEKRFMYRHKYYDVRGSRKEKKQSSFFTDKDALKALIEVKAALLSGNFKHVEHSQLTVAQWLDTWFETYHTRWKVSTRFQRRNAIDKQMKPLIGNFKLSNLDKSTYIREYITNLQKKYSDRTVALYHRLFKIAINAAVEDEIIPRNRFRKINLEIGASIDNVLTVQELNLFLEISKLSENITIYTLILLLAYTGVRKGEAFSLRWKNIDFERGTIKIDGTRDRHGFRSPKTKLSKRTIPVDPLLLHQLLLYQQWCVKTKFSYGMKLDKKDDFIFISYQDGLPVSGNIASVAFKRIFKRLHDQGVEIQSVTAHGLRHTHATILINQGIPATSIAKRLGNTTDMIYKVYAHSFKEFETKSVSAFSEGLTTVSGAKVGAT